LFKVVGFLLWHRHSRWLVWLLHHSGAGAPLLPRRSIGLAPAFLEARLGRTSCVIADVTD
jgi:hypothetical protein